MTTQSDTSSKAETGQVRYRTFEIKQTTLDLVLQKLGAQPWAQVNDAMVALLEDTRTLPQHYHGQVGATGEDGEISDQKQKRRPGRPRGSGRKSSRSPKSSATLADGDGSVDSTPRGV